MPLLRIAILLLCVFVLTGAQGAQTEPVPLAHFFDNPSYGAAELSPDARHLAIVVNSSRGRDRLAVVELATLAIKVVAEYSDGDVDDFQWVNNHRLVYDLRDKTRAPGELRYAPGLYAVNRDGSGARRLVDVLDRTISEHALRARVLPWNTFMLRQRGGQGGATAPDAIYVQQPHFSGTQITHTDLLLLDTVTGRSTGVKRPGPVRRWLLDAAGEPRIAVTLDRERQTMHFLDPAKRTWRTLASPSIVDGDGAGHAFEPLAFGPDGTLFVVTRDGDKKALARYDFEANRPEREALVKLQDFDFNGKLIATRDKVLGVRYLSDAHATVWFDAGMKKVQEAVDKLLPATINLIEVAPRAEASWVLVQSYSDRQPRVTQLYDTAAGTLTMIGRSLPNIDPVRMAPQDLVRYQARDGLTIPAWLTLPKEARQDGGKDASTSKKLPLVLLVHGGPYVRGGEWEWQAEVQFLASRGYAVLAPEFRGSTGFGHAHFRAGWKQWGLAMQDDIADGARWAIAQGIADPGRICIMGASYGGYAALMGPIRDPALYRCAIDYMGVTDIGLLYTGHWSANSDISETAQRYSMPILVGDPVKDAAQLAATSPLKQAARITVPLLLAYGGVDKRVPIYHGRKFRDAVAATNKQVEWVVYDNEAHGWSLVSTRIDFWGRVERFLRTHIGPAP